MSTGDPVCHACSGLCENVGYIRTPCPGRRHSAVSFAPVGATSAEISDLVEAARLRVAEGCSDTCSARLISEGSYPCDCGHEALKAALEAVDRRKELL